METKINGEELPYVVCKLNKGESVVTENGCATDCTITVIDSSKYAVPDPSNPSSPTGAPDTTQSPSDDTFPWWLVAGAAAGVGAVVLGGATLIVGAVIGVVTAFVGFLTHLFWGW